MTFRLYDLFAGGNLAPVTIFALGINPSITASIIVQVVVLAWRYLARRTDKLGRRHLIQYT